MRTLNISILTVTIPAVEKNTFFFVKWCMSNRFRPGPNGLSLLFVTLELVKHVESAAALLFVLRYWTDTVVKELQHSDRLTTISKFIHFLHVALMVGRRQTDERQKEFNTGPTPRCNAEIESIR